LALFLLMRTSGGNFQLGVQGRDQRPLRARKHAKRSEPESNPDGSAGEVEVALSQRDAACARIRVEVSKVSNVALHPDVRTEHAQVAAAKIPGGVFAADIAEPRLASEVLTNEADATHCIRPQACALTTEGNSKNDIAHERLDTAALEDRA